jgi:ACS family hexuronate transporter-like MFS transporter
MSENQLFTLTARDEVAVVSPTHKKPTNFRWVIVGLLMAGAAVNYIDRSCMGIVAPKIQEEFKLSNTQIGFILGMFQWGYVAAYMLAGMMIDRFGVRKGYPIIMAVWSLATAMTSLGTRMSHFVALRVFLGIGEAGCWPASNKVVAEWSPQKERPLACGLFNGGATVGMVFGPPIIAAIVLHWGWRPAFVWTGCIGFVWILFWLLLYRDPEKSSSVNAEELALIRGRQKTELPSVTTETLSRIDRTQDGPEPEIALASDAARLTLKSLLGYPQVWGVLVLNASTATTWFVLANWLPKYFYDARGIDFSLLGWYTAMPMVGGALGNILGGWCLGWLISRTTPNVTKARRTMIFISVAMMTCLIPAVYINNVLISTIFMAVVGFGYGSHAVNILSSISDFVDQHLVATFTSIQATGTFLVTLPLVTYAGWIVEEFGYTELFVVTALMPYLSIVAAYTLIRRFGPLKIKASA